MKHLSLSLIYKTTGTVEHKEIVYEWCIECFFFYRPFMWVSIFAVHLKAGLFLGFISKLIDLYFFIVRRPAELLFNADWISFSIRGKQHLRQWKWLWMSWSIPHSPFYLCSLSCLLPTFWPLFPLLPFTFCFAASLCSLQGLSCYFVYEYAYVYFINAWYSYMLIAPLLPKAFETLPSFSLSFLFPSSSACTWAPTWGPGNKCWCVSWDWPR